jgi:hypothetical protein
MKAFSVCRCLLCQLELDLKEEFGQTDQAGHFAKIAAAAPLLSGYPTLFALTTYLRSCRSNGNGRHPADAILLEMLHLRRKNQTDTLLPDVLLLAFIPVLPATSRQLGRRYPAGPVNLAPAE